jgi:protein SCO1/2
MSDETITSGGAAPERMWLKVVPAMVLLLVLVATLSFLLVKGPSKPALPGGAQQTHAGEGYYGTLALPAKQAPPIDLRNYLGQHVTLSQYRGKAVLVTFLYANCPDICPLIASNLRVALNMLGRRDSEVQVIAVSVDPRGDTPANVARFVRDHEMTGRMQYLIGSAAELAPTWKAWNVGSEREAGQPQLIAHSALVYGISAAGKLTTIYPATFEPSEIAHDVPKLAAQ